MTSPPSSASDVLPDTPLRGHDDAAPFARQIHFARPLAGDIARMRVMPTYRGVKS